MRPFLASRIKPVVLAIVLAMPVGAMAQGASSTSSAPNAGSATEQAPTHEMLKRVEQRIADLHAKLHITSTEDQQWQQFAGVMRDNAAKMEHIAAERAEKFSSLNAIENMQSYADAAEQHAENMKRLTAAFQTLYNAMSDAQKKTADEVFRNYAQRKHKG